MADVYAGYSEMARILTNANPERPRPSGGAYTRQQIHTWYMRRNRNGFPERHTFTTTSGREMEGFKVAEVLEWFDTYRGQKGGRPSGNV